MLPFDKPFERQSDATALSEVSFRLVVDFNSDAPKVIGSCTAINGLLALTAKHVVEDYVQDTAHTLDAIQIIDGKHYIVWSVTGGWSHPFTDLALLRLATPPGVSDTSLVIEPKGLLVDPFHPLVGQRVAAFGYHSSRVEVSRNPNGSRHIDVRDEPTVSVGLVRAVHPQGRDRVVAPFPCYQVEARYDAGMSGGPVFDDRGAVCGVVFTGYEGAHSDGLPISYVTTLWPLFGMIINANRQGIVPRDVPYPVIELARGNQVGVVDLARLERQLATPDWIPKAR